MKFYRVEMMTVRDGHAGYSFFSSLKEAEAEAAQFKKNWKGMGTPFSVGIEAIEIEPTSKGILHALRTYAAHPDNG